MGHGGAMLRPTSAGAVAKICKLFMNTTLPPILETKLADFRRRVWVLKLTEGLLGAVFGVVSRRVLRLPSDYGVPVLAGLIPDQ